MDHQTNQTQGQTTEQPYQQQQAPYGGQYQQPPYGGQPPHGGQYQQPYGGHPYPQYPPVKPRQPAHGFAVASLVLGIVAMTLPLPVIDIIIGVLGLIFAVIAKKRGHQGGMSTAGLVLSILGTIFSVWSTISAFAGLFWFSAFNFHRFM